MSSGLRLVLVALAMLAQNVFAHGGVVEEEDLCVIKVNYLRGHFKIYQPLTDGHKEYCEDLPNATQSVFVMEYLHDSLSKAAVDFRIIRDVTGKGRFARWEDVAALDDLDSATVFYQAPAVEPDVLTVIHAFAEEGDYIGIVTANVDGNGQIYRAVFPFEVGFTGLGYWPVFVVLLIAIQIQYLIMSGRIARWRERYRASGPERKVAALLFLVFAHAVCINDAVAESASEWVSERGIYQLSFDSSLDPIEINQMHSWVLYVSMNGDPVKGARISVSGGMPAHDHGLPTRPRITEELDEGAYRLEGMRFHMSGDWEVSIDIEADGKTDTVIISLTL